MNKDVYKIVLGGVTVRLRNKANVPISFLENIFSYSMLDDRELLLILDDKNGTEYGTNGLRASATPACMFDWHPHSPILDKAMNVTIIQNTIPCRDDMETIDLVESNEWDVVVYVPKVTTDKWKDFKPYFALVIGHELSHVKVIRQNLDFHMCATWLFENNYEIFIKAGKCCISLKKWNFPLELYCNRNGKLGAIELFGEKDFHDSLSSLILDQKESSEHKKYLAFVRDELEGEPYAKNIVQSICFDLQSYYNEETTMAAHTLWKEQRSEGVENANFDLNMFLPLK